MKLTNGQFDSLVARLERMEAKNMFGGTVLGQALWSAVHEPKEDHPAVIEALIAAGAKVNPAWSTGNERIDALLRRHRGV